MAGDGVSLPQTIAQLGSVAKTQARGQQTSQQVTPFAEQIDKKDDLKTQRVKEIQKAEQQKIDPDEEKDKRRKRRFRRNQKYLAALEEEKKSEQSAEDQENEEKVGALFDLRA